MILFKYLPFIYPHLDAYVAIRHMGFFASEVDVGAQGLERNLAFLELFGASDLGPAQAAAETDADALDFLVSHDFLYGLFQDAAERQTLFQSFGDHHAGDGGIGLRAPHFLDVELELLAGQVYLGFADKSDDLLAKLDDAVAGLADEHAGARRLDDNANALLGALDVDAADVEGAELFLQEFADDDVGLERSAIALVRSEPAALPVADDSKPMGIWMYGVGHVSKWKVESGKWKVSYYFLAGLLLFATLNFPPSTFVASVIDTWLVRFLMGWAEPRETGIWRLRT